MMTTSTKTEKMSLRKRNSVSNFFFCYLAFVWHFFVCERITTLMLIMAGRSLLMPGSSFLADGFFLTQEEKNVVDKKNSKRNPE